MKRLIQLGSLLILVSSLSASASDNKPGQIQKVEVFPSAEEVRVEITLSADVVPLIETAQNPDRLVVKLPGTTSTARQIRIAVGQYGVRGVRYGLNQASPPETHLVVDLTEEHPYKVTTSGKKIILFIQPSLRELAQRRNVPAAAASKPLLNSLERGSQPSRGNLNGQSSSEGVLLTPPPSGPPIQFPQAKASETSTTAGAATPSAGQPSASPNLAGVQQQANEGTGVAPVSTTNASQAAAGPSPAALPTAPEAQSSVATADSNTGASNASSATASASASSSNALANSIPASSATPGSNAPSGPSSAPSETGTSNAQNGPSPASSVTVSAAQGSAPKQPFPQEPKLPATPSPESAAPVQAAPETSLPPATGQAQAEKANQAPTAEAEAAPAEQTQAETPASEQVSGEGSGEAHIPQIARREAENPDFRTAFRVKFVEQDAAYLDGGRAAGLMEGMKLMVRDLPNAGGVATQGANSKAAGDVAELDVLSVAENSAVTEIHQPKRPVRVGDLAYLSAADQQALVEKTTLSATRKYPAVISFTENDTLDEEARAEVPKPPSPAVNRSRGRIGFDYIGVRDPGPTSMYTNDVGLVVQTDMSRIGGTYWNATGYWRGRFDHTTNTGPQTLQDTINRTYQLYTAYENPNSSWVAGFGRMYLPWATSLYTIDGGYAGRKLTHGITSGIFFGSTPDPTSFSYAPNRQLGGAFVNFSGGSFDNFHYSSTFGGGLDMLSWTPDRPFAFFENSINYKRVFSIYQASQVDSRSTHVFPCPTSTVAILQCAGETLTGSTYTGGSFTQTGTNWGLGRSFTTVRFMPHPRIELHVNHTYYRDLPFLDPSYITSGGLAAGLFNQFLSEGLMGGARVEVLRQIWVSGDVGKSSYSGESKGSLNEMFGVTFGHVPWVKASLDARYNRFNSSFGTGSFESLSFTRNLSDAMQIQILAGQQNFASSLTAANTARFVNGMFGMNLGRHYFMQFGGTLSRGNQMNYDQWLITFGYRFDNREGQKAK